MYRSLIVFVVPLFLSLLSLPIAATAIAQEYDTEGSSQARFIYLNPTPGTASASAGTTIAARQGGAIDNSTLSNSVFTVVGSISGQHSGKTLLSTDGTTIIFEPDNAFTPGEEVTAAIAPGLTTRDQVALAGENWTFRVSPKPYPYSKQAVAELQPPGCTASATCSFISLPGPGVRGLVDGQQQSSTTTASMPHYVTAPDLLPQIVITKTGAALGDGSIFMAPLWFWNADSGRYLLILHDNAELVYYHSNPTPAFDFKRQFNGNLTYFNQGDASYKVLDSSYKEIDSWSAGNGYVTDNHELQLLPNGHALLMIYDTQPFDLSPYGGPADAQVIDLVIQELDEGKHVVFQWNSRDYIPITDTQQDINTAYLDYIHGNAIELDYDGNLLLSSRHLSEITKIDRYRGTIIWRLGGKQNQFTFIGDQTLPGVGGFSYQHDIRRLPNGHITLFDNGLQFYGGGIRGSRGVEYSLDETAKTATRVKDFRQTPDVVSLYMGNMQRLPSGNSFIGWGGGLLPPTAAPPSEAATEFTSDGHVAMSLNIVGTPFVSYRALRFPWQGYPTTIPTLVAVTSTLPISLYYSWNGATEVISYTVSGGITGDALTPFAVQPKTGFEERTSLDDAPTGACFFRVTPNDKAGNQNLASNIVYLGDSLCPNHVSVAPTEAASRTVVLPSLNGAMTTTLSVDQGAVATNTVFTLTPAGDMTTTVPNGQDWTGFSFTVGAFGAEYLAGDLNATNALSTSIQLTINYQALALPGLTSLNLVRWDAAQQSFDSSGITLLSNDAVHRQMVVSATSPGIYALLANNRLLLPAIRTQGTVNP